MNSNAVQLNYGSILTTPLIDLFSLSDEEKEYIWAAFDLLELATVISDRAELNRLQRWCVFGEDPLSYLLTLTVETIHQRWNNSERFSALLVLMQESFESILGVSPILDLQYKCDDTLFFPSMQNTILENLLIELAYSRVSAKADCICTYKKLSLLSEKGIIQERGFTFETIEMLQRLKVHSEAYQELVLLMTTHYDFKKYNSFDEFITQWLLLFMLSQRNVDIIKRRMAWGYDESQTLEEIGVKFSITRERVRQVESIFIRKKKHHIPQILPIWITVESLLNRYGILSLRETTQKVKTALQWTDELSVEGLSNLLEYAPSDLCDIQKKDKSVYLKSQKIKCLDCTEILDYVKETVLLQQKMSVDSLSTDIVAYCEGNCKSNRFELGESFIEWLVNDQNLVCGAIKSHDKMLFHIDSWNLQFGKLSHAIESLLRKKKSAIHFTDLCEELNRLRADSVRFEPNNVHATLDRLSNVLLWGRGSYIHRQNIKCVNSALLKEIEDWLIAALHREGLPFISIFGAFKHFYVQCAAEGIVSEPALYSWLKSESDSRLQFPHYPYLDLGIDEYTEGRIALLIEQTVRDAGGELSLVELKKFIMQALHLKEHVFSQHLSRTPNILRVKRGYIHSDHISIDKYKLSQIVDRTLSILERVPHISVQKVFDETRVICASMSIDCPELLYSILQVHADHKLRATRYPALERMDRHRVVHAGITNEIINFIYEKQTFCSYQELSETFVKKLGYSIQTVEAAIRKDTILRYAQGCLVHRDVLEWSSDRQCCLESIAEEVYMANCSAGFFYSEIGEISESEALPKLTNDLYWTDTLIADLLSQSGHYNVLGWRNNIYVKSPNFFEIESFEDIVVKILEDKFGGAANIDEFEGELVERDLIKKLGPNSFRASSRIIISGKEILLNRNLSNA